MNPFLFALPPLAVGFFWLAKYAETKDDKLVLVLLGSLVLVIFGIAVAFPP